MARHTHQRRLAAILAADVAAFSRAMEVDEEGTYARLTNLRETVVTPAIAEHSGRLFKTTGDGFLVEFSSSVDAVRCAIEIQQGLNRLANDLSSDQKLDLRIGVNIGDVICERDDLFGNGVNVASRLESLARPGGICVSERVFEDCERLVDAAFEFQGPVQVKNIQRSVNVYEVILDPTQPRQESPPGRTARGRLTGRKTLLAALIGLAVLGIGVGSRFADRLEGWGSEEGGNDTLTLPERPSVAVLPFTNLSGEAAQGYFADGITDDLITDLSKISGLFVIARNSAFRYRSADQPVQEVAAALGVQYVLQGSVRRAGDQIRINAQLTDALAGATIWADRYDGERADIFAFQDKVTNQIVSVLSIQLTEVEQAVLAQPETTIPDAYDAFLRGWQRYVAQTPEDLKIAIEHFEQAVLLDPDYGRAHAAIAASYWQITRRWWHGEFGFANVHRARVHAERLLARALRWETPLAHQVATAMLSQQGRHTEALAEGAKAIALDPNNADSFATLAGALSLAGDADRALNLLQKAMRLNPRSPAWYFYEQGLAEFALDNFTRAANAFELAIKLTPDDRWSKRLLLAVYGHLGRLAEADAIVSEAGASWLNTDPFTIRAITYWYPYKDELDKDRLVDGLRKAGLPE